MTRINLIDPSLLCDKHLMAEYRELIRIPNGVLTGRLKNQYPDAPSKYTLGSGHIKFFVDKLEWLYYRHLELHNELLVRGFKVSKMDWSTIVNSPIWKHIPYTPTPAEISLNLSRIIDRMPANPKWTGRVTPRYWINHSLKGA